MQLKDESAYEKLFEDDDCQSNDEHTYGSSANPLSLSSRTGSSNNQNGSVHEFTGSFIYQEFSVSNGEESMSINVDDVLNHDLSHNTQNLVDEKDIQVISIPEIKPIISREGMR